MKNESESTRVEQLQKMLQLAPKDAFLAYALGLEYQKLNKHAAACSFFDKALETDSQYLAAYYQKAISLYAHELVKEAIECLEIGLGAAKALGDTKAQAEMNNFKMNLLLELD